MRRRMMFSRPTKAPLRMNKTFEVSTAYDSGHSTQHVVSSDNCRWMATTHGLARAWPDPALYDFPLMELGWKALSPEH